jgi:Mor family transcriptional regulator
MNLKQVACQIFLTRKEKFRYRSIYLPFSTKAVSKIIEHKEMKKNYTGDSVYEI